MEEMDLKPKDLIGIIGGKSAVSEVLNKKKKLTVEMIRALETKLHISASLLIKNYPLNIHQ
jgi:HTH-type transcriptional regulator / antitoxin HigA